MFLNPTLDIPAGSVDAAVIGHARVRRPRGSRPWASIRPGGRYNASVSRDAAGGYHARHKRSGSTVLYHFSAQPLHDLASDVAVQVIPC